MLANSPAPILNVIDHGVTTVVHFAYKTSLTEDHAEAFGREIADLIACRSRQTLSFDLGPLDFVSSVGLSMFVGLNGRIRAAGGQLILINLKSTIRRVFAVSRLDRLLDIQTDPLPQMA